MGFYPRAIVTLGPRIHVNIYALFCLSFIGTPLRSGPVTFFSKTCLSCYQRIYSVSNLFCCTLICPLWIWQLGLILECIGWTGKRVATYAFPRSTDIIQVLNELPTDKRHIGVPLDRLLCHTCKRRHQEKTGFQKKKKIIRPQRRPFLFMVG